MACKLLSVNVCRLMTGVFLLSFLSFQPLWSKTARLAAFGDSLMAGYGLAPEDGFVPRLSQALTDRGFDVEVVNVSVSGDTSKAGLKRLDWTLATGFDAVLLELGANDALQGLDPAQLERNLDDILRRLKEKAMPVMLFGMMAPRSLDDRYIEAFDLLYPRLAEKYQIAFYPFFLDGVAGEPLLNQGDGKHPNAEGVGLIIERLLPTLTNFLETEGLGLSKDQ